MAENLTDRQAKWFATIRDGLERETGKSIDAWVAIAKTCPETKHRARLQWFEVHHGLLQNRASIVLGEAFGGKMWDEPEILVNNLWSDPTAREIFEAVRSAATGLPDTIETARKGYTAWSRKVQFAALKPLKSGGALLGLAVLETSNPRLEPAKGDGWSERLTARLKLSAPEEVAGFVREMGAAWERS